MTSIRVFRYIEEIDAFVVTPEFQRLAERLGRVLISPLTPASLHRHSEVLRRIPTPWQVDVLLEREDGARRLWIEFEISRAHPVANHARFATAQLFEPRHSYHQNGE